MSDWQELNFCDLLIEPVRNGIYKQKSFHGRGAKIVNMGELFSYPRLKNVPMKRLELNDNERKKCLLNKGDLIFARRSLTAEGAGKCSIIKEIEEDTTFESSIIRARPNPEKSDSDFLYYLFNAPYGKYLLGTILRQVAVAGITGSDLMQLVLKVPYLEEQKAIASVLSSLDDKIDLLHRQNTTLERMAETLFRQWFVEEAQEDWVDGRISDLVNILSGFAFKSTSFNDNGEYKLITIKAVQDGYLELNNADKILELPVKLPSYCVLNYGDVLLSLTGNVGRCCVVDNEKLLLNQRVAKLQPKKQRDWAFMYVLFRQASMKSQLEELAKGTAQANLSPIETANIELKLPPDSLLEYFSLQTTPLLEKLLKNKKQIQILEKLRDNLLPKLMSGEIRLKY